MANVKLEDLLRKLAAPARRAIEAHSITTLAELDELDDVEIASWHGISKNAMAVIRAAVREPVMSPKAVLAKWVEAFNCADVDTIVSLYHNDATNHQVANEPVIGVDAIRTMFTAEFSAAKMVCIVENIFEDGEWAIMEWRDPLGLRGCGFFHIVKGKIILQRGYWDKLSFLRQHNLPIE